MDIVGTLRNARRITDPQVDPRAPCLHGQVYGDTKGRFRDGDVITTSRIDEEFPETGIFKTRFSVYRVESWADAPKAANDNIRTILRMLIEQCEASGVTQIPAGETRPDLERLRVTLDAAKQAAA